MAASVTGVLTLQPYHAEFQSQVANLIITIQQDEFGVPITLADQPDLEDIEHFYQSRGGQFWVALDADQVVGTIALRDIGNHQGALRKMFVHPDYRGKDKGVAQALLDTLIAHCTEVGIYDIYLGTTEAFKAAHRFYEKNDFVVIDAAALPSAFPNMGVDTRFYYRQLAR